MSAKKKAKVTRKKPAAARTLANLDHGPPPVDVFVNIPFDEKMEPLVPALVTALAATNRRARSVLEVRETGKGRLRRLYALLSKCRASVHDLSRVEAPTGHPRFNMPFELGMAWAIRAARPKAHEIVVMETEPFRLQRTLSDLNGVDPLIHEGKPHVLLTRLTAVFADEDAPPRIDALERLYGVVETRAADVKRLHGGVFTPRGWTLLVKAALAVARTVVRI